MPKYSLESCIITTAIISLKCSGSLDSSFLSEDLLDDLPVVQAKLFHEHCYYLDFSGHVFLSKL